MGPFEITEKDRTFSNNLLEDPNLSLRAKFELSLTIRTGVSPRVDFKMAPFTPMRVQI